MHLSSSSSLLAALLLLLLPSLAADAPSSSPSPAGITPSPSVPHFPEQSPAKTPTPTPAPGLPSISREEAETRLKMLQKELNELNEKLQRAEEELIGDYPHLAELKRLVEEANRKRKTANENWLGVHKRYTSLYHQLRQKYDEELQQKIKALEAEYERKFKEEWSTYEAQRREENRLMQQAAEKAAAELKAALRDYRAALEKAGFFTNPALNAIRERMKEIAREKAPLIMLLKPRRPAKATRPVAAPARSSPTPRPTPAAPH